MRHRSRLGYLCVVCVGMTLSVHVSSAQTVTAETRFVDRLVELDLADLAIDYLERAGSDPLVPAAFQRVAPYRRAAIRVDQAASLRRTDRRAAALKEAREAIRALASPTDPASIEAQALTDAVGRLGLAEADAARMATLAAANAAKSRSAAISQARESLTNAKDRLNEAVVRFEAELETLRGAVVATSEAGQRRSDLKMRLAQARLLAARMDNELAGTYREGSPEAERLNRAAAERLGELYQKYSKWVVGLYAHLYEGRCYRQLGEEALAAACFESLVTQPATTPELSRLVTLANAELVALRLVKGEVDLAIEEGEAWLDQLDTSRRSESEVATLSYWLGIAHQQRATEPDANDASKKRGLRAARKLLGEAARVPSEVQALARTAWASATAALGVSTEKPRTFDEAYRAGKDAIESYSAAEVGLTALAPENRATRAEFEAQRDDSRLAAEAAFETAIELANKKSSQEQLNEARYLLAYLNYTTVRDQRAINLAARVALRSSDDPSAEAAARLAMAALERRSREPIDSNEATRIEANLTKLAEFTAKRWPTGEAASIARGVLLSRALASEDLARADAIVAKAPEANRAGLALRIAAARWERGRGKSAEQSDRTADIETLRAALATATESDVAIPLRATAALYLAEGLLDAGDPTAALELLEAPEHGVAVVLGERTPPANTTAFALAAARVCVRAYAWDDKQPDRATGAIEQLEGLVEEMAGPDKALRDALLSVAVKQQADLASIDRSGAGRSHAIATLGETLGRLREPLSTADWNSALWRGQALLKLAGEAQGDEGLKYALAASVAFEQIATRIESESGFAPSASAGLAIKLQLGECNRKRGDFAGAFEAFASLLKERPALLEVQQSAACTLQDWGASESDPQRLEQAIAGTRPDGAGKNSVWGWAKLAAVAGQAAARDPKRRDLFFEAWLNVAQCRYEAANLTSGAKRTTQLRKAASTVRAMKQQYPNLGGEQRKRQFTELGEKIEATLKRAAS